MKKGKRLLFSLLCFAIILSFVIPISAPAEASPATIYVPDDHSTIQAAVDAASAGDTIIVRDGTYTENINVNTANLTIRSENGADSTIVQALNPEDHVFDVTSENAEISGLTIKGATGGSYPNRSAGVRTFVPSRIADNEIVDNNCGITLRGPDSIITGNSIHDNFRGIDFLYGDFNVITRNTVSNNTQGFGLMGGSDGNLIYLNTFMNNDSHGVYMRPAGWDWPRNTGYSSEELTYNYHDNTYVGYLGNHWSDYSGSDDNGDGIGDTPYPVGIDEDTYPLMEPFENYEIGGDTTPPDTEITSGPSGEIDYNDVTFTWTGSDDVSPTSELVYSYYLEGYDSEWSAWASDTSKQYISLPDGDYIFEVKAKDQVGNVDASPAQRSFTVTVVTVSLSVPIYAPNPQSAPQGTELTYIAKATNRGNEEDTINFSVSGQSISEDPEEWWDLQFSSSSITLASGESEDIAVKLVIPKGDPGRTNRITIRGESSVVSDCFDEVTIIATEMEPDAILFAVELGFKLSGSHVLRLDAPDFAEISDHEISHPGLVVQVVFNPKDPGDLDNAYIKVTDTVDGQEISPPVILQIRFEQRADDVVDTDFDMHRDAYSFSNNDWAGEEKKCYGMAATSILYFISKLSLPPDKTTYDLDLEEARCYVEVYQDDRWYNHIVKNCILRFEDDEMEEKEYSILKEYVSRGEPMIFFLAGGEGEQEKGHAVVAYRIVEDTVSKSSYILVYDNTWPYVQGTGKFYRAFPYITYDRDSGVLSYESYTKFKLATAAPWYKQVRILSPASLSVYDSQGRVTGLVDDQVKNEIPYSLYEEEIQIITILFSSESYRYQVVGIEEGTYGLTVTSVKDKEVMTFTATDIPTASGAIHEYTVDWDALAQGEEGVTVHVDSDGDGVFENSFASDDELTQSEFLSETTEADLVGHSAWPEHHHFVLSKDGSDVDDKHGTPRKQTIYGKVRNTGTTELPAGKYKVVWEIFTSDNVTVSTYETTGTEALAPGEITTPPLTYDLDVSAELSGSVKYYVTARCWYHDIPGEKIKKFKFTVVP